MAWTAEITGKDEASGILAVTVQYTDGKTTVTETIQTKEPNGDWPVPDIQARLKSLELVSSKPINVGPVAPAVDVSVDPDLVAYAALVMRARHLRRMADIGVKAGAADLTTVLTALEAGYKPEYESLF